MPTHPQSVILVDANDDVRGDMEKMEAHRRGLLHRAFSVFVFRAPGDDPELLLQQRQTDKYHCGGLWTNTCCSHPRPGEATLAAAERRLQEEMGLTVPLTHIDHFIYEAPFDNGLTEHELDHVFVGYSDTEPVPNPTEVDATRWVRISDLQQEIDTNPAAFTPWLQPALKLAVTATSD